MHRAQVEFCLKVKERFPQAFQRVWVLDCGSRDVNGNNRYLFKDSEYIGVDLALGRNVTIVMAVNNLAFGDGFFDTIICTEMLEHDRQWKLSLINMVRMLRSGGLLLITCATTGRQEHGTDKYCPEDSPATNDYYRNLTEQDIRQAIDISAFETAEFEIDEGRGDLYFYGIKGSKV